VARSRSPSEVVVEEQRAFVEHVLLGDAASHRQHALEDRRARERAIPVQRAVRIEVEIAVAVDVPANCAPSGRDVPGGLSSPADALSSLKAYAPPGPTGPRFW
jgi:hypothetical protein